MRLYIGLVSFERGDNNTDLLPPEAEGAVGWMAGRAQNEQQFEHFLSVELAEVGLKFSTVENVQEVVDESQLDSRDEHLVENIKLWKTGKNTVWGTVHLYLAEGES